MADQTESVRDEMIGRLVGSWRVVKLLGEGGMGSVYMGEHPAIGSKVAIKMLHPRFDADERIVERFFNEAKAVNVIGHENIVNILDFNVADGRRHYFVMEFLHGQPLQALVDPGTPIALRRAGPILLQCCRALQAAHDRGIVHRDFKPDNVFLVEWGGRADFVKLVDFGIAKLTDTANPHLTQTGTVMGTPAYMSPEQAAGERDIDARSDIYSLGVTLFQMATGKLPFAKAGPSFGRILAAHLSEPPPLPSALNPEIPAELEGIILKTLEKSPDQRYQSMTELHDALLGCMERLGIGAQPSQPDGRPATIGAKASAAPRSNATVTPARGATLPRRTVAGDAPPRRRGVPVLLFGAATVIAIGIAALGFFWARGSDAPEPRRPAPAPRVREEPASAEPAQARAGEVERAAPPSARQSPPADIPAAPPSPSVEAGAPRRQTAPGRTEERRVAQATTRQNSMPAATPKRLGVFFQCAGVPEVCSALRAAVDDELQKARFANLRNAGKADVALNARVTTVQGRAAPDQQFAVRTYSIEISGEAVQSSEAVAMPAPTTLSYDPSFGSERVAEKARLVAGEVAEKLQGFVAGR